MSYCQENVDQIIGHIDRYLNNSKCGECNTWGLSEFYPERDIEEAGRQWEERQEILDDPTDWRHELLIHPHDSPPGHKG